jgi:hypothetical protein
MHQPYQRIIIMHLAILTGGILVMELNSPLPLLIILIGLKIAVDVYLHNKSHRTTAQLKKETLKTTK